MLISIISLALSLGYYFSSLPEPSISSLSILIFSIGILFLFLPFLAIAFSWSIIQKSEKNITYGIAELFKKDKTLFLLYLVFLFPLLSFITLYLLQNHLFPTKIIISTWMLLLGVSIDLLFYSLKKIYGYIDGYEIINKISHNGTLAIQKDEDLNLYRSLDECTELAVRSISSFSIGLANHSIDALQKLNKIFFDSSKLITHSLDEVKTKGPGKPDLISYTLVYLLQRLETINDHAVEKKLEPICSHLASAMGKITIAAAKFDISLAGHPLYFLGRFILKAQQNNIEEIGPKAIYVLLEVAKSILTEIDVTYLELQEPFFTLIKQMQDITNKIFKKNKSIHIRILMQPFQEIRSLFTTEKMSKHRDSPSIIAKIDQILAEYQALDDMLRVVPPIPPINLA